MPVSCPAEWYCPASLSLQHHAAVSQALALVPNASRPFVPFRARSFCTQQQRQQVANKLLGSYLVLLLQELSVEPGKQKEVRHAHASDLFSSSLLKHVQQGQLATASFYHSQ